MNIQTSPSKSAGVELKGLAKSFGAALVISDLSVSFRSGSISVLLGSSGCGKTTILRCIAGLEEADRGQIKINGHTVFSAAENINFQPEQRDIGMVFQSYAIWPHMTVFENVALPLRARGLRGAVVASRVGDMLELVGLGDFAQRGATRLSGGQQQRVAIARCLVSRPGLILLDEPLSNLDARLRVSMRSELRDLQRRFGITMIFVTHDQEEAMSLADEIFLFRGGELLQSGPAATLYFRPSDRYVAEFFGKVNIFTARIAHRAGEDMLCAAGTDLCIARGRIEPAAGELCMVRPEAWRVTMGEDWGLPGRVLQITLLGDRLELQVETAIGPQCVVTLGYHPITVGDKVHLQVAPENIHFFPALASARAAPIDDHQNL